jgi:hypothetical protein
VTDASYRDEQYTRHGLSAVVKNIRKVFA